MANLILRTLTRPGDTTKSSPLTNAEVDQNFISIDEDLDTKAPLNGAVMTNIDINSGTIDGTSVGAASASTGRFTSVGVTDTTPSVSTSTGAVTVAGGVGVAGKITATDLQVTNTITGSVSGNAGSATQLQTARTINGTSFNGTANITTTNWGTSRTISYTGDVTGSASVNGSANVSFDMTLANSGVTAGTYGRVTVNSKGLVTAGSSLESADIPNLDAAKITSGVFATARIPTGISITGNAATATTAVSAESAGRAGFADAAISATVTTSSTNSAFKVPFANTTANTTGEYGLLQDSEGSFTYNPSTNTLTVTNLQGNAATASQTSQSVTFNNSGNGVASGTTFNGSTARTVSYNTIGAPSTTGAGASGLWGISITGNAASASSASRVEAIVGGTTSAELVRGNMADNDQFRILVGGSSRDQGFAEIATADNGDEPIYVRQYSGPFTTVTRTLTLLDSDGNTSFPGHLTAAGNVTAYSDIKLKTDLLKIDNALDKVSQLTGYTYTRKDSGERQTGLIAQDVQKVLPEAVIEGEHLSLAYGNLVGLLVEAIKELKAEVELLKGAR